MTRTRLSEEDTARLPDFARDGSILLPQACRHDAIDRFQQAVARAFREGNPSVLYQNHFNNGTLPLTEPVDRLGTRGVDAFVALPEALELFPTPVLMDFLKLIFNDSPLLFQSLSFDQGSQQGLHQDTAYVVVKRPLELAA